MPIVLLFILSLLLSCTNRKQIEVQLEIPDSIQVILKNQTNTAETQSKALPQIDPDQLLANMFINNDQYLAVMNKYFKQENIYKYQHIDPNWSRTLYFQSQRWKKGSEGKPTEADQTICNINYFQESKRIKTLTFDSDGKVLEEEDWGYDNHGQFEWRAKRFFNKSGDSIRHRHVKKGSGLSSSFCLNPYTGSIDTVVDGKGIEKHFNSNHNYQIFFYFRGKCLYEQRFKNKSLTLTIIKLNGTHLQISDKFEKMYCYKKSRMATTWLVDADGEIQFYDWSQEQSARQKNIEASGIPHIPMSKRWNSKEEMDREMSRLRKIWAPIYSQLRKNHLKDAKAAFKSAGISQEVMDLDRSPYKEIEHN